MSSLARLRRESLAVLSPPTGGRRRLTSSASSFEMNIFMWKNLAPNLIRQRVIIEGTTEKIVEPEQIKSYLSELAKVADMEVLSEPEAHSAHDMGYGGWIHWKSSGAAFYSYPTNPPLFTVDCYTCKPFSAEEAAEFTRKYFNAIEFVWQEVEV